MKRAKLLFVIVPVFSLMVMASNVAAAEVFFDIYAGVAFPDDKNGDLSFDPGGTVSDKLEFDNDFTLGLRGGIWFTETEQKLDWFGFAADFSYFQTEAKGTVGDGKADIYVIPMTALVMFRYPGEMVQPYVGLGGGLFISNLEQKFDTTVGGQPISGNFSDTAYSGGFDLRAGLAIKFLERFAVFAEGRYIFVNNVEYKEVVNGVEVTAELDYEVLFALLGISFRF